MKIGYARISTIDQNAALQHDALRAAECETIFEDKVSGSTPKRPGLERALEKLGQGDELIVWRLDRLGRSLPHLIQVIATIGDKGAGFKSLTESIDTGTAGGRLVFHMMGALAEFERALMVERTRAGLSAARKRGVRVGRPPALSPAQVNHARKLIAGGEAPGAVARSLGVSRSTLYRAIQV
jgi:DNA invertase Pin-like site-specific DNA recombinase